MKNVRHATAQNHRLSGRILAFMLAFSMLLGVCPTVFASGETTVSVTGSTKFTGDITDGAVENGQPFGLMVNAAFSADANGYYDPEVRLYIGDMAVESFVSIVGGAKTPGADSYIANGVKYSVMYDDVKKEKYILIQHYDSDTKGVIAWKAGDTLATTLGVQFDSNAVSGTAWNVHLEIYNPASPGTPAFTTSSETIKSKSDAEMNNTKTSNTTDIMLKAVEGATTLGTDLVYTLSAFTGTTPDNSTKLTVGEAPVTEYTITDTLTLPDGLYIKGSAASDVMQALSASFAGYTVTDIVTDSNGIKGFTLTYKVTNPNPAAQQIRDFSGTVTLNADKVKVTDTFKNTSTDKAKITNTISTTYATINGSGHYVTPDTVTTNVYRPVSASYSNGDKTIAAVSDKYNTWNDGNGYLLEGDLVLYKIYFKNTGDVDLARGTVTDTLPDGVALITNPTADEKQNLKSKMGWLTDEQLNGGAFVTKSKADVLISGNTVSFSNVAIAAQGEFEAYVLAKVNTVSSAGTITNTASLGDGDNISVGFKTQPKAADIKIDKNVVNNTAGRLNSEYMPGDSVTYTITVSNTGSADAENVAVTDLFPSSLVAVNNITVDGAAVSLTPTGDANAETKTYDFGNLSIAAQNNKTIVINGTIGTDINAESIVNTAKAVYGGKTVTDDAVIYKHNQASNVSIKKTSDKDGQLVPEGGTITYTITVDMGSETFTADSPLLVSDIFPSGLTVGDSTITYSNEGSLAVPTKQGQQVTYSITGSGAVTITVTGTVNSGIADGTAFINTAQVVGGSSAASGTSWKGTPDAVTAVKTATIYRKNAGGTEEAVGTITNGQSSTVQAGDRIEFDIVVTNNNTEPLTSFTLKDTLVGKYKSEHSTWTVTNTNSNSTHTQNIDPYPIHMTVKSKSSDNVKGFDENEIWRWEGTTVPFITNAATGTYTLEENKAVINSYGESTFEFKKVPIYEQENQGNFITMWQNEELSIPAGDSVTFTYSVTAADNFTAGSNSVTALGSTQTSTVSYALPTPEPTPTPEPGATEAPAATPTANPNAPVLSINKSVGRTFEGVEKGEFVKELVFADENAITGMGNDTLVLYSVEIKNTSDYNYTTMRATLMDQLPEQFKLAQDGKPYAIPYNVHTNTKLAYIPKEGDYVNAEWIDYNTAIQNITTYHAPIDAYNWIAVQLQTSEDGSFTLKAHESVRINYFLTLSTDCRNALTEEAATHAPSFEFEQQTASNTAYFTGDEYFNNTDNNNVRIIADSETVTIRSKTVHPGITKTAYAYLEESAADFQYNSNGAHAGAYLIWKLRVDNQKDTNGTGKEMTCYELTDILPNGYSYIENNTYTNTAANPVTYPSGLSDTDLNKGKFIKHCADGTTVEIDYFNPTKNTDGTLVWVFNAKNNTNFTLQPGEYIEFTIITKPELINGEYRSGVYYNKARLKVDDKYYEDTIKVGTVEDGGIADGDSFSINTIITEGKISVKTSTGDEAVGGTEDKIATGEAGKNVTYTMTVTNTDPYSNEIKNVSIINRIPYVGDSGVLVSGQRGSEYDVQYANSIKVYVHDRNGNKKELTADDYTFTTYSGDITKVFEEDSADWSKLDEEGWSTEWNGSTKLIRVQVGNDSNPIVLKAREWIEVTYEATLPAQGGADDLTAWNSFAYHYDANDNSVQNMAAEPASVGVQLPKNTTLTGKITVKKVFASRCGETKTATFYFSVFDEEYADGAKALQTKSVTVTVSGSLAKPSNAEVEFTDLPYTVIGKQKRYYIYETDANGVPLTQAGTNYIMFTGFYRPDKAKTENGLYDSMPDAGNWELSAANSTDGKAYVLDYAEDYSTLNKGLSPTQTTNSAIFSNIDLTKPATVEPSAEVLGTYYSDIASTKSLASNDTLYTGKTTFNEYGNVLNYGEKYNAQQGDRFTQTYDGNKLVTERNGWSFGDGFGNYQGHTVSTGFLARITGGTESTITGATWKITSQPQKKFGTADHEVYVRLNTNEKVAFDNKLVEKGYKLSTQPAFTDDLGSDKRGYQSAIYQIIENDDTASLTSVENAVEMGNGISSEESGEWSVGDESSSDNAGNVSGLDDDIVFESDPEDFMSLTDDDAAVLAELNAEAEEKALKWTIKDDSMTEMTLSSEATVYVGIILDQIYDREAHAVLTLNDTSGTNSLSSKATAGVGNADQVNVMNPNDSSVIALPLISSEVTWNFENGADFNALVDRKALSNDGKAYVNGGQEFTPNGLRIGPDQYVTLNVPANAVITVKATGGGAGTTDEGRALTVKDVDGNVIIARYNVKTSDADGKVDGIDYKCIGNQTGVFYGSTPEDKSFALTQGGIINITSTNSNLMIRSITVKTRTTWDFSEFTDQKTVADYNGLKLVFGSDATKDYVSSAGFRMNGTSSETARHIKYTPTFDGTMTVTYKSNNKDANDRRITAIGTSVLPEGVLAAGYTNGATPQTITCNLTAGTTYYIYSANGGQTITKLEFEYVPASN